MEYTIIELEKYINSRWKDCDPEEREIFSMWANQKEREEAMAEAASVLEYALEETIRQFDYTNDPGFQESFKGSMIKIALTDRKSVV
jgi:hypothetical protein